jgi:DNA-binding transcriptional MerR regulator
VEYQVNTSGNLENVRALVRKAPGDGVRKGIQEVAEYLGVTQRTLRFYEGKGLIDPERVGSTRVYTRRDIGRMRFSIREIVEFLDLYDADPDHVEQMARLAERVRERLADLEKQQIALVDTMRELRQIEQEAMARIEQASPARSTRRNPSQS